MSGAGCPMVSNKSGEKGLVWPAKIAKTTPGCPIVGQELEQVPLAPQTGADDGKQPAEAMCPVGEEGQVTEQEIDQQGHPHLPPHRIGAGAQKVGQLEGLLDLFEENFDLPPAAVKFHNIHRTPSQLVA